MANVKSRLCVVGLVLAAACIGAEPKLTVMIYDYAGTPGAILKAAAETARQQFRWAGVETDWTICRVSRNPHEHCALPPVGTIQVNVMPPELEGGLHSSEALGGYAMMCPGCVISYAFYQPVKALAGAKRSVSAALAIVMAHEVGHLLGLGHTSSGIMKALLTGRDIQDAEMGRMRFTEGEAKLRAAAAERELTLLAAVN